MTWSTIWLKPVSLVSCYANFSSLMCSTKQCPERKDVYALDCHSDIFKPTYVYCMFKVRFVSPLSRIRFFFLFSYPRIIDGPILKFIESSGGIDSFSPQNIVRRVAPLTNLLPHTEINQQTNSGKHEKALHFKWPPETHN